MLKTDTATRSIAELLAEIEILTIEIQHLYLSGCTLIVGWSGGKDSTTALQLIWNAILELPVSQRIHDIWVVTNDTLVENPAVSAQVRHSLKQMEIEAKKQGMPIRTHMTQPPVDQTFWVCVIGKGYPAPRQGFRWCTERLKIDPAEQFIRKIIADNQQPIVLVLGVRKAESAARAATMEKQREEFQISDRLNANPIHSGSQTYSPIRDWSTNEIWIYLNQWDNPWGASNKDLFAMYRGATADNECPLVVDTTTPSCGSSRFGCWVCSVVDKDKSMEAMIQNDEEKEWMQPLLDLRNELDVRDEKGHHADHGRREERRATGVVQLYERKDKDGTTSLQPIPGPYLRVWREHWLRRLLAAQVLVRKNAPPEMRDIVLITQEELSEIRRIWLEEKHEFDDSLPSIYEELTGEPFEYLRPELGAILDGDAWNVLDGLCEDDKRHLELMAKLLNTERKYFNKPRRTGIFEELDKHFKTSSLSDEDALDRAHYDRELKIALGGKVNEEFLPPNIAVVKRLLVEGASRQPNRIVKQCLPPDLEEIKKSLTEGKQEGHRQLSWAHIKFSGDAKN
jgi:DNA sulfur modification protein DndC